MKVDAMDAQEVAKKKRAYLHLGFLYSQADKIYKRYEEFSDKLIESSPSKRASQAGAFLLATGIAAALLKVWITKWFDFSETLAPTMIMVGGLLIGVSVLAEVWIMSNSLNNLSKQSESLTAEIREEQKSIYLEFISGSQEQGEDPKKISES